jgi:hypothetical protein
MKSSSVNEVVEPSTATSSKTGAAGVFVGGTGVLVGGIEVSTGAGGTVVVGRTSVTAWQAESSRIPMKNKMHSRLNIDGILPNRIVGMIQKHFKECNLNQDGLSIVTSVTISIE